MQKLRVLAARPLLVSIVAVGLSVTPIAGQSRALNGQPDLQGIWDFRSATPLERPRELASKEFFTDDEAADYERRAALRDDGRPPDDVRTEPTVHPPYWLDYGKKVVGTKRTSLITDPADGKIPALSPEGQKRAAERAAARRAHGPADSPEDRSLFERCLTRGVPGGLLPGPYNSNLHLIQTPDHVVLLTEMIHEARIVRMDGSPHAPSSVRFWAGDSRGHWEGETLVVDTTNFLEQSNFLGAGPNLHVVERLTRTGARTITYEFTVEDPTTWSRPWTATYPMLASAGPMYEYACHEGNYGLRNILGSARVNEKAAHGE